ncbi:TPA: hypothetical protein ACXM6S_005108, partial [Serratia marcescens]
TRRHLSPRQRLFFIGNVISRSSNPGNFEVFSEKLSAVLFSSEKLVENCGERHAFRITRRSQMPVPFSQISIILQNAPCTQHSNGLITSPKLMR